jgi:hypothetical protein
LTRLKRENRQLKEEREILSKAAAWLCVQKGGHVQQEIDLPGKKSETP